MNYSAFYIIHFECADTFNMKTMTKDTHTQGLLALAHSKKKVFYLYAE